MIRILINWMNPGRIFQNLNHLIFLCKMNRDTLTHHQNKTEHLTLRLAQDELSLSGFPRSQVYDGRIGLPVCIMSRPKLFSTKMRMQGGKIRDTPSDTLTIAICSEISPRSHTAPFLMSFPLPFLFLSPSFPFSPLLSSPFHSSSFLYTGLFLYLHKYETMCSDRAPQER